MLSSRPPLFSALAALRHCPPWAAPPLPVWPGPHPMHQSILKPCPLPALRKPRPQLQAPVPCPLPGGPGLSQLHSGLQRAALGHLASPPGGPPAAGAGPGLRNLAESRPPPLGRPRLGAQEVLLPIALLQSGGGASERVPAALHPRRPPRGAGGDPVPLASNSTPVSEPRRVACRPRCQNLPPGSLGGACCTATGWPRGWRLPGRTSRCRGWGMRAAVSEGQAQPEGGGWRGARGTLTCHASS